MMRIAIDNATRVISRRIHREILASKRLHVQIRMDKTSLRADTAINVPRNVLDFCVSRGCDNLRVTGVTAKMEK